MIRGAFILAVGFALGYTKALQEQEEIRETLSGMADDLKRVVNSSGDRAEEPEDSPDIKNRFTIDDTDDEPEGETQS